MLIGIRSTGSPMVKSWWTSLLIGVMAIVAGVLCFATPDKSLAAISYVFIVSFIIGGVLEIVFSLVNRKTLHSWGWSFTAGIFELLLGIIFLSLPTQLMVSIMIYTVGFWILFRSVWGIGEAFELKAMKVKGWGWLLVLGILAVGFSFFYLLSPAFGGIFLVSFVGMALILYGCLRIVMAFELHTAPKVPDAPETEVQPDA